MSEFRVWMRAMGLNAKEVSVAAEMLGITTVVASHLSRGKRELSHQERLAMAALLAGLKPWDESRNLECLIMRASSHLAASLHQNARKIAELSSTFIAEVNRVNGEASSALAAIEAAKSED